MNNFADTSFVFVENLFYSLRDLFLLNNNVLHTNSKALVNKPIINDFLHSTHKISTCLWTKVFNYYMV